MLSYSLNLFNAKKAVNKCEKTMKIVLYFDKCKCKPTINYTKKNPSPKHKVHIIKKNDFNSLLRLCRQIRCGNETARPHPSGTHLTL